jgi:hypothetical protein
MQFLSPYEDPEKVCNLIIGNIEENALLSMRLTFARTIRGGAAFIE